MIPRSTWARVLTRLYLTHVCTFIRCIHYLKWQVIGVMSAWMDDSTSNTCSLYALLSCMYHGAHRSPYVSLYRAFPVELPLYHLSNEGQLSSTSCVHVHYRRASLQYIVLAKDRTLAASMTISIHTHWQEGLNFMYVYKYVRKNAPHRSRNFRALSCTWVLGGRGLGWWDSWFCVQILALVAFHLLQTMFIQFISMHDFVMCAGKWEVCVLRVCVRVLSVCFGTFEASAQSLNRECCFLMWTSVAGHESSITSHAH
jgi:hypothetical protein